MKLTLASIVFLLAPLLGFGQETVIPDEQSNHVFNLYAFGGSFLNQETKGFNLTFNGQIQKKNSVGFGIDLTRGFYQSPSLNKSPNKEIITAYPEDSQDPVPKVNVKGRDDDIFTGIAPYISKEFSWGSFFALDIQAGPGLGFILVREYTYGYSPGGGWFGGPNFGTSASISANSTENKKVILNGYARAVLKFKLGKLFRIGVSSFANINGVESNSGIQIGVGFSF